MKSSSVVSCAFGGSHQFQSTVNPVTYQCSVCRIQAVCLACCQEFGTFLDAGPYRFTCGLHGVESAVVRYTAVQRLQARSEFFQSRWVGEE
jgi:hypothetical protein